MMIRAMRAAIYARYSSENQTDRAQSGAQQDRSGLIALREGARNRLFDVVLVDDLSRLARSNHLMLTLIAEFRFHGVRVVSVADALDSEDEAAILPIQTRGIFNELLLSVLLSDLRKTT